MSYPLISLKCMSVYAPDIEEGSKGLLLWLRFITSKQNQAIKSFLKEGHNIT